MIKRTFYHIISNTLLSVVTNMFVWFALTFWVFLETRSLLATSLIAGIFALTNAVSAFYFGSIVDHNKKKRVFLLSSFLSLGFYIIGTILFFSAGLNTTVDVNSPLLWTFIIIMMIGSIIGNLRSIAVVTIVSLFFEHEERAKMNGLVGSTQGIAFAFTSVLSGLAIGYIGMANSLYCVLAAMVMTIVHVLFIDFTAKDEVPKVNIESTKKVDWSGTYNLLKLTPGIIALILFTSFNNFLGGVFMALMDSYALSIIDVKLWGILLGFMSFGFILGGIIVAKWGLGKSPLRTLFNVGMFTWTVAMFFTVPHGIPLFIVGIFIWMTCAPIVEAAESTILQKVIPFERQGRVIGFAQTLEQLASPITAFLIGPLTHFLVVPFMTTGLGAETIGSWFGTGQVRAMALVFTVTGFIGLLASLFAKYSNAAKRLEEKYQEN